MTDFLVQITEALTLVTLASRSKEAARLYLCLYSGGENVMLEQFSVSSCDRTTGTVSDDIITVSNSYYRLTVTANDITCEMHKHDKHK